MKSTALISRRHFLALSASTAAAAASGCAVNPVTGRRQLMFVSESMEVELERRWAPHQFSADYGAVQDEGLNHYLVDLTQRMAAHTHRPDLPYNSRALNAVVVNAYTFPAGSMGFARGLLLALGSEAELVAVMGHEMGHASARHAASSQTSGVITQMLVAGVAAYVESEYQDYAFLAAGLGGLGAYALLSRYSRDNEREADKLGMEYLVRGGYAPKGMVGVMDMFKAMNQRKPGMLEILFATHPMSPERYDSAVRRTGRYADLQGLKEGRERYMDHTAGLRRIGPAIEALQSGQTALAQQQIPEAETHIKHALKVAPDDYAGLLMMAKCLMAAKRHDEAQRYAAQAKAVFPDEPQARHISGMANLNHLQFESALEDFTAYETALPGNPNTAFYRGYSLDKMDHRQQAAHEYTRYLRIAPNGEFSVWTRQRLDAWGTG